MCCNCYFSGYKFIIFALALLFFRLLFALRMLAHNSPKQTWKCESRARNVYDNLTNPSIICSFASFGSAEGARERGVKMNPREDF